MSIDNDLPINRRHLEGIIALDEPRLNLPEQTVSELATALKRTIEDAYGYVRVRGELSGVQRAASGHLYCCLKDESARLDGVMWRGQAAGLPFRVEDGIEVIRVLHGHRDIEAILGPED